MPDAIITSTASTFGTITGTFAADQSTVTGTVTGIITGSLTGSVGVPGPAGAAGAPGQGVPAGGASGQYLQKTSNADYATDWVTINLSAYAVKANNLSDLTSASTARTNLGLGTMAVATAADYSTTTVANGLYYPLAGNPSSFLTAAALSPYLTSATAASTYQTLAGMSSYLTTATAASTYAVIAAGQPTAGTTGQVLTKNSGTNYDSSWATLIPGDRYLTSSTTSNTVSNGNKTFTIGTGLSYTPTQNITISYDASNHMHGEVLTYNSGTGVLTVDVNHHTGSGTYTAWVVNVGGVTPATSVAWGAITGTLSAQTDLQSALDAKLFASTASFTYAALTGATFTGSVNLSSLGVTFSDATTQTTAGLSPATAASTYQTIAGMSTYAPKASPALTGNVTIVSNSAGAALFIEQAGAGNILTLHDQSSDTTFVAIDANGKVNTIASEATNGAGFNIAHGAAPTTPVNGDIWTTTTGLFMRQNGTTKQYVDFDTSQTINGNKTFSNATQTLGNSTATGTISVASGATISASTKTVNIGTGGVVGSTTNTTIGPVLGASTTSIGNTTAASTLNLATGATLTATTKAVNIGTNGVAGSTTNITIGSTTGTSTTTLQGTTNGVTAAADTNSVALATTAYVVGQASAVAPSNDAATAEVGTSLRYARADHVHLNPLPAGGSANQVLAKVDATSYNTQWVTPSGGGSATDYQEFTTPGTFTWTKPAGAKWVDVVMFGGGGGGGAGGRYATSSARSGGAGGSGGTVLAARMSASALGATQTVVVGAGANGGASASADTTAGGAGAIGGSSTFYIFQAAGGIAGQGGSTTAPSATTGRVAWIYGTSATGNTSGGGGAGAVGAGVGGGTVSAVNAYMPSGGAGGAGQAATVTTATAGAAGGSKSSAGGAGAQSGLISAIAGGAAGTTGGTAPTAGVAGGSQTGGTGGGSGAYRTAVAGMAGAAGGFPGGGGGGGSASDNGFASGAGGAGGAGAVYIITYC
jgi:hypothetical protein